MPRLSQTLNKSGESANTKTATTAKSLECSPHVAENRLETRHRRLLFSSHQRLGITFRQKNTPPPGSLWLLTGIQTWIPFRGTQTLGSESRPGCPLKATEALVRVHYAALPATPQAELGLGGAGGAAIAAVSVSGGAALDALAAIGGGIGGGGPHIARFICSAMLCLTSVGATVGRATRTLDHGHMKKSVPMGYT